MKHGKSFNTVVIIDVQNFKARGACKGLNELEEYTLPREIIHHLVLEFGVEEDAISIYPIMEFMDSYNNGELAVDNTFIGFTNLQEEVA